MLRKFRCYSLLRVLLSFAVVYVILFSCIALRRVYIIEKTFYLPQKSRKLIPHGAQKCQRPTLNLWPPGTAHTAELPICKPDDSVHEKIWVERGRLRITTPRTINTFSRSCSLFPIIRMDDFTSVYGEGIANVTDNTKLRWPNVMVLCQPRENLEAQPGAAWNEQAFKTQQRHFICGSFPPKVLAAPPATRTQTPPYNILLLGLDSVSHAVALRYLPKTMHLLKSNPLAVIMQLYNVVGDGTTTNLMSLLNGHFEEELPEARRSHTAVVNRTATVLDNYPWIWNNYLEAGGYATHYIEDSPRLGTFHYRLNGFGSTGTPTHSYGRPCLLAAAAEEKHYGKQLGCINSRYTHHVLLESLREFFYAYEDRPRFSLTFLSELIHDEPSYARLLDDDLVTLFRQIEADDEQATLFNKPQPFANTLVVFFADHGPRIGRARLSLQGKLEERLPLLSIIRPKRFAADWPEAAAQLRANQDRLVTLFDVHASLKHLLMRQYGSHLETAIKSPRGKSLFTPIPANRTCAQASIAPHWCSCLQWTDVRRRRMLGQWPSDVMKAAYHLMSHVNERVQRLNFGRAKAERKCQEMRISKIQSAEEVSVSEEVLRFEQSADTDGRVPSFSDKRLTVNDHRPTGLNSLRLHIVLDPGAAHFEGTLNINMTSGLADKSSIDISRMDRYEEKASCIPPLHMPELRRFCVCG